MTCTVPGGPLPYLPMFVIHRTLLDITLLLYLLLPILLLHYPVEFYLIVYPYSWILILESASTETNLTSTPCSWADPDPAKSFTDSACLSPLAPVYSKVVPSTQRMLPIILSVSIWEYSTGFLVWLLAYDPRRHEPLSIKPGRKLWRYQIYPKVAKWAHHLHPFPWANGVVLCTPWTKTWTLPWWLHIPCILKTEYVHMWLPGAPFPRGGKRPQKDKWPPTLW